MNFTSSPFERMMKEVPWPGQRRPLCRMPLLQGVQRKEKTVPQEILGADRGALPFGPSWPEVLNGLPGADP